MWPTLECNVWCIGPELGCCMCCARPGSRGKDAAADAVDASAGDLLSGLAASVLAGRTGFGERVDRRDVRVGHEGRAVRMEPASRGPLWAAIDGFSLNAGPWVSARDRERLEASCRYAARPAVSEPRLAELPDGRI